jgi:hypothetical protein
LAQRVASCLLFLAAAATGWAQVPAGPEFRVNGQTTANQVATGVSMDARGNFVVVFHSELQDGNYAGIFARRYEATGAAAGPEVQVNTFTTNGQFNPAVASDAAGNFVVAWESFGQDGSDMGIFGQRFDAAGAPRGAEFRVNTHTPDDQDAAAVASDASGNFVVVWQSRTQDGSQYGVFAQRYDAAGAPRGGEFRVNTTTGQSQLGPQVASDANGNFVVVWQSPDGYGYGIFAQRYASSGAPLGVEFRVNGYTSYTQGRPDVASGPAGDFVVTWISLHDEHDFGVFAQRFDAQGSPQGAELHVNTFTTGTQTAPRVAMDSAGNVVIVWEGAGQDGSGQGVFAQRYDASGAVRGAEFRVNPFTTGDQGEPEVARDATGNFTVVWTSAGQDGSGYGGFGQRFGGLHALTLAVDGTAGAGSDGNGVLEPGETVPVAPGWRNSTGAQQAPTAAATAFDGPPGAIYTIADGSAAYDLPDGATAACTGCYSLAVTDPAARPAVHWDASFVETMLPEAVHGQEKPWTVHLGESFTDVPRTNTFYRFIETLLHHGVTGGCAPEQYCPASSATRREMAVFVVVADEGAAFTPPACVPGAETFDDVPAASGFCPWIEELARRGVVGGCGTSPPLYCPGQAVTRAQMAVFVLATREPGITPPACVNGQERFEDVDHASPFCPWIEELARRGIVSGCSASPARYCPADAVSRAQMGVFIGGTFGLALYAP